MAWYRINYHPTLARVELLLPESFSSSLHRSKTVLSVDLSLETVTAICIWLNHLCFTVTHSVGIETTSGFYYPSLLVLPCSKRQATSKA